MLEWVKTHRRSAVICGVTLLVPLVVYLNIFFGAWSLRSGYAQEIDRLQPRIARLAGLQEHESELAGAAGNARQVLESLVYPANTNRAEVSAGLQNNVWQLMTDAGMSVTNSQVLPLREGESFDYVGLKLTVTGGLDALDQALASLSEFAPIVIVESVDVWPNRQRSSRDKSPPRQEVTASFQLVSLRAVL